MVPPGTVMLSNADQMQLPTGAGVMWLARVNTLLRLIHSNVYV